MKIESLVCDLCGGSIEQSTAIILLIDDMETEFCCRCGSEFVQKICDRIPHEEAARWCSIIEASRRQIKARVVENK